MNKEAARKIMESEWLPVLYSRADLTEFLGVSQDDAEVIVWEITGDPEEPGVAHHELVSYLRDILTISQVPDSPAELPKQGLWLLEQGWSLNPTRSTFRWMNPYAGRGVSFSLRAAIKAELRKQFIEDFDDSHSTDADDVIDADYYVRDEE